MACVIRTGPNFGYLRFAISIAYNPGSGTRERPRLSQAGRQRAVVETELRQLGNAARRGTRVLTRVGLRVLSIAFFTTRS